MAELKFVITGTPGVGKTTALCAISDVPPIITDAATTDELAKIKDATTVAMDFGEVHLEDGTIVRVYGTPGQERFRHMWEIIGEGALGLIVLVDITRENPVDDMMIYLDNFQALIDETGVVIGVTRNEQASNFSMDDLNNHLNANGLYFPVLEADPRNRQDMIDLLDTLMAMLEYA